MSQPDTIPNLTAALRADMARVSTLIEAEQAAMVADWLSVPSAVRSHRLAVFQARVLTALERLDKAAASSLPQAFSTAFETGAWAAALVGGVEPAISASTAAAFASTTLDDILRATTGVRETTKILIRELGRDQMLRAIYTGTTAKQAGADLRKILEEHRIHAVTYADGKRVSLAQYTDMLLRTKTAEAYQAGAFDQAEEHGWDWWEIMDGDACGLASHNDPVKANGLIVPLEVARAHPLSHPSCLRATSPRPDIRTAAEAEGALPMNPEALAEVQARAVDAAAAGRSVRAGIGRHAQVATVVPMTRPAGVARAATAASVATRLAGPAGVMA